MSKRTVEDRDFEFRRSSRKEHSSLLNESSKTVLKGPPRKWEQKWIYVGHLKLLRWVPVNGIITAPHFLDLVRSDSGSKNSRTFSENAPITRSISAAFSKDQKKAKHEHNLRSSTIEDPLKKHRQFQTEEEELDELLLQD